MENVNPMPNLITQDIEKKCDTSFNNTNDKDNNKKNIFWLDDFNILFEEKNIYNLWPREDMTRIQKLNAITRLVILFTLVGCIFFQNTKILITGIITILFIIATKYILDNKYNSINEEKEIFEKFSNEITYQRLKHNFSNPTQQNPVMNTLLPEIVSNPKKLPAAPSYNSAVKEEINNSVKEMVLTNLGSKNLEDKLFDNLGNNMPTTLDNSMRQFYTTANTLIPNNQKSFANFCYGNMAKCKDGEVDKCLIRNTNLNN